MRILAADKLDASSFDVLDGTGVELVDRAGIERDQLLDDIADYDALVVRSRTTVDADLLVRAGRLRVVGRAGTGVDNIDVDAATRRGVLVMNTPGANSNSAAEHAVALMTASCRNVACADADMRAGRYEPRRFVGVELRGRTLAILGLGRIGMLVAEKARGLGMHVIGYDPVTTPAVATQHGVELTTVDDALARADVVSLHVPLLEDTRHLLDRARLASMKRGVRIVNCARGGLIDEEALLEALESGHVAGAALDVFEHEPPEGSPLLRLSQVVATPHLGASTVEAQAVVTRMVLEQVADHLRGIATRGAINGLGIDDATREAVGGYLVLARRLGKFVGTLRGSFEKLTASYYGALCSKNARALTSYFLAGYLSCFLDEEISELAAYATARERGLEVEETARDEHRSFQSLAYFVLEGAAGKRVGIAGTMFGKSSLRLVRFSGHNLDTVPEGVMLVVRNQDEPGVVGALGSALGEAGVNIANMSLGRKDGEALAILNLDERPPGSVLAKIRGQDGVIEVSVVDVGISR